MDEEVFDSIIATNFLTQDGISIAEVLADSLNAYEDDDSIHPIGIAKAVMENTAALVKIAESIDRFTAEVTAIATHFSHNRPS